MSANSFLEIKFFRDKLVVSASWKLWGRGLRVDEKGRSGGSRLCRICAGVIFNSFEEGPVFFTLKLFNVKE